MKKKTLIILAIFIILAALVTVLARVELAKSELLQNQLKWKSLHIRHYRFEMRFTDYWGSGAGPMIIEVQDDQVISKTFKNGTPITDKGFEGHIFNVTVDYLFSILWSSPVRKADEVYVEYHPVYGFPKSIFIDYDKNSADEEHGWSIRNFEVLPPPQTSNFQARLVIYPVLSTIFLFGGIVIIYWLHNQHHLDIVVKPAPPPQNPPMISICIPARNEERNIRACVESVLKQNYPKFEVIVLDDRSTDATPGILRELAAQNKKLKLIHGSDLPAGWAGKPHALFQASATARGDWLCFIDADTFLYPKTLSSCYAKAVETQADMFTIMTFQVLETFWEKTVMPLVMTALSVGFSPRKVNNPKTKDAIANGQFILIKRQVYDAIGGHASVKGSIVEDKAISERVKWNGYRLIVADGVKAAKTRMYTSLPEMWEGWTKNIYLVLSDRPGLMALGVFGASLAVLAALFLPLWPLLGYFWFANGGGWQAAVILGEALILWAYLIKVRADASSKMKISLWYALTTPLGAGVFAAMMFTSAWKVLSRKGVTWKGRTYRAK